MTRKFLAACVGVFYVLFLAWALWSGGKSRGYELGYKACSIDNPIEEIHYGYFLLDLGSDSLPTRHEEFSQTYFGDSLQCRTEFNAVVYQLEDFYNVTDSCNCPLLIAKEFH